MSDDRFEPLLTQVRERQRAEMRALLRRQRRWAFAGMTFSLLVAAWCLVFLIYGLRTGNTTIATVNGVCLPINLLWVALWVRDIRRGAR